jgi:hypothetical protein
MGIKEDLEELFQLLPSTLAPRVVSKENLETDLERANHFLLQMKAKYQIDWEKECKGLLDCIMHALTTVGVDTVTSVIDYLNDMDKRLKLGFILETSSKYPDVQDLFWNSNQNPLFP